MSAPVAVNTADGTCWTRRGALRGGEALYAPADVCKCPEFVMATLSELAELGIVGSADALPMPTGPAPQPRTVLEQRNAHARELLELRARLDDVHRVPQDQITQAEVRLAQYGERTSTWSTATYDSGTEKALHEIACGLRDALEMTRDQRNSARLKVMGLEARVAELKADREANDREYEAATARIADLETEREKLVRWHDEDSKTITTLVARVDRYRARLVALQNDALNMRGSLAPNGEDRKVPFELGETLTPAVDWLIARVAELENRLAKLKRRIEAEECCCPEPAPLCMGCWCRCHDEDEGLSGPCDCGEGTVHYTAADCPAAQRAAETGGAE